MIWQSKTSEAKFLARPPVQRNPSGRITIGESFRGSEFSISFMKLICCIPKMRLYPPNLYSYCTIHYPCDHFLVFLVFALLAPKYPTFAIVTNISVIQLYVYICHHEQEKSLPSPFPFLQPLSSPLQIQHRCQITTQPYHPHRLRCAEDVLTSTFSQLPPQPQPQPNLDGCGGNKRWM